MRPIPDQVEIMAVIVSVLVSWNLLLSIILFCFYKNPRHTKD